jgi:4-amino-4-deoxy-L-arabinose transferase-like glycosyltransferase
MWSSFQTWWKLRSRVEQWSTVSVGVASILGVALRFTNLASGLQFQADQGRDALIAYGILHGDLALIGPSTSVGSMFLGPLYYYFMAPFIGLFGNSPVGPAVAVASIGVLTIPLLYWIVRQWFGSAVATWTVLLYTAAPWVLEYTRFSWNPNPAPAVSLLLWWSAWKAINGSPRWWAVVGFWTAVIIQLHYVALLAVVPLGLWWLWQTGTYVWKKNWSVLSSQLLWTLAAGAIVLASLSPLVIFDIRFDGLIRKGFSDYFAQTTTTKSAPVARFMDVIREQEGRALYTFGEFWGGKNAYPGYRASVRLILLVSLILWLMWGVRLKRSGKGREWLYISLIAWTSLLGLAWYRGVVYAHYVSYLFPIVPLMVAGVVTELALRGRLTRILAGALITICALGAVIPDSYPFLRPLGWQYTDMKGIAEIVLQEVPAENTYSLTLLSEIRDYRGLNYRYFLVTSDRPPVDLEVAHEADFLVVIAESPDDPTHVLGSPVYEIVNFPKGEYRVVQPERGPKIYIIENKQKAASVSGETRP